MAELAHTHTGARYESSIKSVLSFFYFRETGTESSQGIESSQYLLVSLHLAVWHEARAQSDETSRSCLRRYYFSLVSARFCWLYDFAVTRLLVSAGYMILRLLVDTPPSTHAIYMAFPLGINLRHVYFGKQVNFLFYDPYNKISLSMYPRQPNICCIVVRFEVMPGCQSIPINSVKRFHTSVGGSVGRGSSLDCIILISLFTNPCARTGYDTRSIFMRSLRGLNSEFSFSQTSCLTKAEELSLSYYISIAGGRTFGFIPFPRVLVLCEMQSASSRI